MNKLLLTTTLLLLSNMTSASSENWSGFYIGANLGHGWGSNHDQGNTDATKETISGFTGGIQAGHNWQLENNIVIGVEAGLSLNDIDGEWKDSDNNEFSPYSGKDEIEQSGSLNVKLGYAVDNFLPYITTGVTVAKTTHSLSCDKSSVSITNGCQVSEFSTSASDIRAGANIGAGVLYKFDDNLSAGVEYIYTNLGSSTVSLQDPNYPDASERRMRTKFSTVTARINYHF
ncbi:outer membrane protein [Aeromonas eucrenophila]|uniref:Outer membrane protein n=1 Tax=Aeromonas eucrenophila TaxID=649 RepID=A0ABW0YC31_9GAMM|nr:outer membrane beta-barrel protein [Aeromonas eucrenophila]